MDKQLAVLLLLVASANAQMLKGATFVSPTPANITAGIARMASTSGMNNNFGTANFTGCATNTLCAPLAWPTQAGNSIVVFFEFTSALTITSVISDQSQTLTSAVTSAAVSSRKVAAYYQACATTGTTYVKVLASGTGVVQHLMAFEVAGLPCSSTLRNSNSATNGSTSTTLNSGSLTPTSGDLLLSFECRAGTPGAGNNFTAGTGQTGATWVLRGVDNQDGCANEWSLWSGSGAINPVMTSASSSTAAGITLDFATSTTQGTNPSGMYLANTYEGNTTVTRTTAQNINYQTPTIGNLQYILGGCGGYVLDPANPPTGTNTWKVLNVLETGDSVVAAAAAQNASVDATGALTLKWVLAQNAANGDCDWTLYDVVGAATSNALGQRYEVFTSQGSGGNLTYTSTFMPGSSSGLQISQDSHNANTAVGCTSPSGCQFLAGIYGGENKDIASLPGQNNFRGAATFSSNAAQTWTNVTGDGAEAFGVYTVDIQAINAPGATLGPYASPLYTGTCSPVCTVTSKTLNTTTAVSPPLASGVIALFVAWDGGSTTITCSDTVNGTYTAVDSPVTVTLGGTSTKFQTHWVLNTTTSSIAPKCVVTGTTMTAGNSWLAWEWINGVTTLDQHPAILSMTPTGSNPCQSNTTGTTTAANEVVVSAYGVGNTAGSPGLNITSMLQDSARSKAWAGGAYSVGSTGTYNAQWNEDTTGSACVVSANTFK